MSMRTARPMSDGGPSTGTLATVSFAGIILWVLLFFVVGQTGGSHPAVVPAVVAAWVLLPVSVGMNATLEPRCSKRYAVLYTLGCAVPLFGIVPASVYLGYTHHP